MNHRRALFITAVVLITLVGSVVRLGHISHPMRYDESWNYLNFVAYGPSQIATHYLPNNHVLHTLCVWLATKIAGDSPAVLRFPAFLCGVLLIPATAVLAWSLHGRWSVALLASLAVAASSALIEYSTNARGYSMQALFVVLGTWAAHSAVTNPLGRKRWLLWGALCAAGTYTVPTTVLPVLGMIIVIAAFALRSADRIDRAAMLRGMGMGVSVFSAATLLGYLPILLVGGTKAFSYSHELANNILGQQITSGWKMLAQMSLLWTRDTSFLLIILAVTGIIMFVIRALRAGLSEQVLPLAMLITPLLMALAIKSPLPARTWIFTIPILATISAAGLSFVGESFFRPSGARRFLSVAFRGLAPSATNLRPSGANERRTCAATNIRPFRANLASARTWTALLQGAPLALLAIGLAMSICDAWKADYLCSEPGGLVLFEPALEECRAQDLEHCALVAPYSPSLAYYQSRHDQISIVPPDSPTAKRVYILTSHDRSLEVLWKTGVPGYENFDGPTLVWTKPGGSLYFAERAVRNVLR